MRLVTFVREGRARLGALHGESVIDLNGAFRALLERRGAALRAAAMADAVLPADVAGFLQGGDESRRAALEAMEYAAGAGESAAWVHPLAAVKLKAPIQKPGKIICVGHNYRDHIIEMGRELPKFPTLFAKFGNTINGPHDPIPKPAASDTLDYEAELACVIGRRARHVDEAEALAYVAGYTVANDVTVREFQRRTLQWLQGKSFDGSCPLGPALVTADEVDAASLRITLHVNGEQRQEANTSNLLFTVPRLVAYLSAIMTLEPGDLILTGTPGGVGDARDPKAYLQDGDVVRVEIESIGAIENRVVDEAKLQG